MAGSKLWSRRTWAYPRKHAFKFGFGLSADSVNQAASTVTFFMHDNALVDYETIKTNPENADFAVYPHPNVAAGSMLGNLNVYMEMFIPKDDTELTILKVESLMINISMLNRLDAFDKKTTTDIENLLELTHEVTDEQAYPLTNGTDLFTGHQSAIDIPVNVPGLTADQSPEGEAWDSIAFRDAQQYYTNKEMLRKVTGPLMTHTITEPIVPHGHPLYRFKSRMRVPSLCKFVQPYDYCGRKVMVPQITNPNQYATANDTTAKEHLTVHGTVRFDEWNEDFNHSRA